MPRDKSYLPTLLNIALPIIFQYLILNGLNMVDVMMVGQMGDTAVASVGLANEIFFLLGLTVFGISSGSAIFTAQFWGKRDLPNLRRSLGISLVSGVLAGMFFSMIAILLPSAALRIYTTDIKVIALGTQYMRIAGFCYIPVAITSSFAAVLRSTGEVRLPMLVSIAAFSLNTALNYLLILGKFGFPALGVQGAAIATLISRCLECSLLLVLVYARRTPAAASLRQMFSVEPGFVRKFLRTMLPVVVNELAWSVGMSTYHAVYARIGTQAIAAVSITFTIENLAFTAFMGIGNACAIMVGNKIGAGDEKKAFEYGKRSLLITVLLALVLGVLLSTVSAEILHFYKISEVTAGYARRLLLISGFVLWIRASNMTIFIGMLRSGGDTRYALLVELASMWLLGVPLAFVSANVLHLPVYWVYLIIISDELGKYLLALWRVFSGKWIHNLVRSVPAPLPLEGSSPAQSDAA